MSAQKIIGILLIVGGGLGIAYGGFSYTKDTHEANLGPLHMEVKEKEQVNIPMWAGVAILAAGVLLVVVGKK